MDITLREAETSDLPAILTLYGQLGQDDGAVLSTEEAGRIWERMLTFAVTEDPAPEAASGFQEITRFREEMVERYDCC